MPDVTWIQDTGVVEGLFRFRNPPEPPPPPRLNFDELISRVNSLMDGTRQPRPFNCHECRSEVLRSESRNGLCRPCWDRRYMYCDQCGQPMPRDAVYDFKGAHKCYNCIAPIMNYSTNVLDHRKWEEAAPNTIHYGVELELFIPAWNLLRAKAVEVLSQVDTWAILKSDSSIRNGSGFEVVSIPGTFEQIRDMWVPFLNKIPSGLVGYKGGCGMHVHVSRNPLSEHAIRCLSVFMNTLENRPYFESIASRKLNRYCRQNTYTNYYTQRAYHSTDRYSILNTTRNSTIEFRMFRSTTKPKQFLRNLEFVEASLGFATTLTDISDFSYSRFIQYVVSQSQQNPSKYVNLREATKTFLRKHDPTSELIGQLC